MLEKLRGKKDSYPHPREIQEDALNIPIPETRVKP